jgi:hypothetical protein
MLLRPQSAHRCWPLVNNQTAQDLLQPLRRQRPASLLEIVYDQVLSFCSSFFWFVWLVPVKRVTARCPLTTLQDDALLRTIKQSPKSTSQEAFVITFGNLLSPKRVISSPAVPIMAMNNSQNRLFCYTPEEEKS